MASRKDQRGRALQKGEFQRADGRYQYSYTDKLGKRHYIYGKSLVELRAKERELLVNSYMGANPEKYGQSASLNFMFDRYMATKLGLKESTYASYYQMYDRYVRDEFGLQLVKDIKYSDLLGFYTFLLKDKDLAIRSIEYVHKMISPALELAVEDGLITKNPARHAYSNFKTSCGKYKRVMHALTIEQQRAFLDYLDGHETLGRYHSIFQVMLGTGMRVGELSGLRWQDVDFEKRQIYINHSLVNVGAIRGKTEKRLKINTPKTEAGCRTIPIMDQVLEGFKEEYRYASARKFPNCVVDGYTDFIFVKQNGQVYTCNRLDTALRVIVQSYNKHEKVIATLEEREPLLLPHITNHVLRHTFCTRLCERDINIKVIQTVMGHSSIKITMDIYAEVSEEKQKQEIDRLAQEIDVF